MKSSAIPFSTIMLFLGIAAGTLAVLVGVLQGWTPFWTAVARQMARLREVGQRRAARALLAAARAQTSRCATPASSSPGCSSAACSLGSWLYGVILAAFFAYVPVLWIERQKSQRRKALNEQLDATLQSMANTILVTQNLEDAFATIAQHFDPPISQEADIVVKQVRLGTPMDEALRDLADALPLAQRRRHRHRAHRRAADRRRAAQGARDDRRRACARRCASKASWSRRRPRARRRSWSWACCRSSSAARCRSSIPSGCSRCSRIRSAGPSSLFACFLEAVGIALVRKFTRIDV